MPLLFSVSDPSETPQKNIFIQITEQSCFQVVLYPPYNHYISIRVHMRIKEQFWGFCNSMPLTKDSSSSERVMYWGWWFGIIQGDIPGFLGIGVSCIACHISCLGFLFPCCTIMQSWWLHQDSVSSPMRLEMVQFVSLSITSRMA